ncbi:hypothetical protein FJ366_02620 [Candidatus Dependentiae bacterium]|nr:hypothetical protein [Candidatus Dependentiae bacterium]
MKSFLEVSRFVLLSVLCISIWCESSKAFSFGRSKISLELKKDVGAVGAEKSPEGKQITFVIKNTLAKKMYLVPFAYVRRFIGQSWHWTKGQVCELESNQECVVDFGSVPNDEDLASVFGNICVLDSYEEAVSATCEIVPSNQKIELDLISHVLGKKILIQSRLYGINGSQLFYTLDSTDQKNVLKPLDFMVVNNTSDPILVTSFLYGRDQSATFFSSWRFSKSLVYEIQPGHKELIQVEKYDREYDRINVKGFLGVFEKENVKQAQDSVYELLSPEQKLSIGRVSELAGKEVVVSREAYGKDSHFVVAMRPAV